MNARSSVFVAATVVALAGGAAIASAQDVLYGTRSRPFEGRRYETMRALAHYLDQTAQEALQTAREDYRRGAQGRRLLPLVRDFARRADSFHTMMDNYEATRRDVPPLVTDLVERARRVNGRLEAPYAAAFRTRQEWGDVVNVLDLMKRAMGGEDVEVPTAHAGFEDYDRDYGPFGNVRRAGDPVSSSAFDLTGARLEEFRRLAHDLDTRALRSHQIAETNRANYTRRQEDFLADLRRFAERAHDVHVRADSGRVDPREMRPIVEQLLRDARETDRSLRDTRVFPEVWDQWASTIDVLDRMVTAVR